MAPPYDADMEDLLRHRIAQETRMLNLENRVGNLEGWKERQEKWQDDMKGWVRGLLASIIILILGVGLDIAVRFVQHMK